MKYQNNDFLLNELKEEFKSIETPNLASQIKAQYIMMKSKEKPKINFKFIFRPAVGLLALLVLVLMVGISNYNSKTPINVPLNEEYHREITFRSLSAINLIPLDNSSNDAIPLSKTFEQEIDDIHKYMLLVEQSLNSNILTKTLKSENKEYKYKDQITMTTPFGQIYEYVFYYNLSNISFKDDDQEYEVNVLMLFEGNQYTLKGKHEVDDNEYETTFIAKLDNNNWVKFELQIEDDEENYLYEIYNNGSFSKIELEIENENGDVEVKLTIEESQEKNQYKFRKITQNNETHIKFNTKDDNIRVSIIHDENNNLLYEYFLENRNKSVHLEGHKKHKDDQGPKKPQKPQGPRGQERSNKNYYNNFEIIPIKSPTQVFI